MKRIAAITLALIMCLGMASCGNSGSTEGDTSKAANTAKTEDKDEDTTPAETEAPVETEAPATTTEAPAENSGEFTKEQYQAMTKDDLLAKIKDIENVTAEEFVWLVSTYQYADIVDEPDQTRDMYLATNPTHEAINAISSKALPEKSTYFDTLLESPYPQVRGYAVSSIDSFFGVSDTNLDKAKELLEKEEDPYVLFCAATALSNSQAKDPAVHDFMMKLAESDNPKLRYKAAISCGTSWSRGVDGCIDAELKLMQDENDDVKLTALSYCGGLNDDAVIEPLKEVLMDPEQSKFHSSAMDGIADLWYDYPFMKDSNEKAYNVAIEYLSQTPRTDKVPYFSCVGKYSSVAADAYDEWKKNSPWFDPDSFCDLMEEILSDGDTGYVARCSAYKVIMAHDPERFKGLGDTIKALEDSGADLVLSSYEQDLETFLEKEGQ